MSYYSSNRKLIKGIHRGPSLAPSRSGNSHPRLLSLSLMVFLLHQAAAVLGVITGKQTNVGGRGRGEVLLARGERNGREAIIELYSFPNLPNEKQKHQMKP